jgi:hypothetical protein
MIGKRNKQKAVAIEHMKERDLANALEHYDSQNPDVQMYSDLRGLLQAKLFEATITDQCSIQVFVRDIEAKVQAEHQRVKKWTEENAML